MTPIERHNHAMNLFDRARELSESERGAFLETACNGDHELRGEVESLLAHDEAPIEFIHRVEQGEGARFVADDLSDDIAGPEFQSRPIDGQVLAKSFAKYTIVRLIAEGGMGAVYEATQDDPRRTVALKLVRLDRAAGDLERRLRQEAHLLGQLQHPGIAIVYDAGAADITLPDGRVVRQPFFAMELIDGNPIDQYVRGKGLSLHAVLHLFAEVCDAVQYAHERGVIHRDMKPANILVDREGRPKILDFGVARFSNPDWRVTTIESYADQLVGTVPYMSPEQISGNSAAVDARSDVYALGVILYKLLANRLPYDITNATIYEAARTIRETEPTHLGSIDRRFRGDIEIVVLKALEKEPHRRYADVRGLAADIRRVLAEQPVAARPPTAIYQLRKFVRRNRILVGGIVATFAALLIGLVATSYFAVRESQLREVAQQNEALARENERAARELGYRAVMVAAAEALSTNNLSAAGQRLAEAPPELRGWEWRWCNAQLDNSLLRWRGPESIAKVIRWNDNDTEIVSLHETDSQQVICRWHAKDGSPIASYNASRNSSLGQRIAVDDQARYGVFVAGDESVRLVDFHTGSESTLVPPTAGIQHLAVGGAGPLVAIRTQAGDVFVSASAAGGFRRLGHTRGNSFGLFVAPDVQAIAVPTTESLIVFDVESGEVLLDETPAVKIGWSQKGGRLMAVSPDKPIVQVWNLFPVNQLAKLAAHEGILTSACFDSSGDHLVSGAFDQTVRITNAADGANLLTLRPGCRPWSCTYSPDGRQIAFGTDDGHVEVWDTQSGVRRANLRGLKARSGAIAFSPDSRRVVACDERGSICVWDTSFADSATLRSHQSYVYPVAVTPDGSLIASGGWDGTIRLWDARTGSPVARWNAGAITVRSLSFDRTGERLLATACDDTGRHVIEVLDLLSGARATRRLDSNSGIAPAFHADGVRVWLPRCDARVSLWNANTNVIDDVPHIALREVNSPAVSAAAGLKAYLDDSDRSLHLVRLASGDDSGPIVAQVRLFRFSPDGRRFALLRSSGNDAYADTIEIWDSFTPRRLAVLAGHAGDVFDAVFSKDGARIFTAGRDQVIRVWDARTFREIMPLRGHTDYVWSLALSADDSRLLSGSGDATVHIWDDVSTSERARDTAEYTAAIERVQERVRSEFRSPRDGRRLLDRLEYRGVERRAAHHVLLRLVAESNNSQE